MIDLSIIVPVYNVEKYIQRCIDSIIEQENGDVKIECIVIDDLGPDKSMEIVHETLNRYKGGVDFYIVTHEKNRGVAAGRNTGIRNAKGNYIMFIDSDDYLMSGSVKTLMNNTYQHQNADIVIGNFFSVRGNKPAYNISNPISYNTQNEIQKKFLTVELDCFPWNRLIRRQFIIENKLFFQEGTIFEDVIWAYHVFDHARTVVKIPDMTYVYENNPMSVMNSTREKATATVRSFVSFCNEMLNQPYRNMFVLHKLYVFNILMKAIDVNMQANVENDVRISLYKTRKRLFSETILSGRILLGLYFLTAFPPFCKILRLSWYRSHFDKIGSIIGKITLRK